MPLATFNVNNMCERAKALNFATWAQGTPILDDFARLSDLIQQPVYTAAIKSELLKIMKRYQGLISKGTSEYILLRENRGDFVKQPKGKPAEIVAAGRASWIGWFELVKEPAKEQATGNIA